MPTQAPVDERGASGASVMLTTAAPTGDGANSSLTHVKLRGLRRVDANANDFGVLRTLGQICADALSGGLR